MSGSTMLSLWLDNGTQIYTKNSRPIMSILGSAAAPAICELGEVGTGIYFSAAAINFSTGGTLRAQVAADGIRTNMFYPITVSSSLSMKGIVSDGASAISNKMGSNTTLATKGAEITAFYTDTFSTKKAAVGLYGTYYQAKATSIQTTNDTQTTALTLTLTDNTGYLIEAQVIGKKSDNSQVASYKLTAGAKRYNGGGAGIIGAVDVKAFEDDTAWDATFTVNGNNLRVSVTGKAATTINWDVYLTYAQN
jgi:hypothetical protein